MYAGSITRVNASKELSFIVSSYESDADRSRRSVRYAARNPVISPMNYKGETAGAEFRQHQVGIAYIPNPEGNALEVNLLILIPEPAGVISRLQPSRIYGMVFRIAAHRIRRFSTSE